MILYNSSFIAYDSFVITFYILGRNTKDYHYTIYFFILTTDLPLKLFISIIYQIKSKNVLLKIDSLCDINCD